VADILTLEKRSLHMARVRQQNTSAERHVRQILRDLGIRASLTSERPSSLPGRPDVVLRQFKTVIFVHGCFWHAHEGCRLATIPKTRRKWWETKFADNKQRDARVLRQVKAAGWNAIVVWGCELKSQNSLKNLRRRLRRRLVPSIVSSLAGVRLARQSSRVG